MLLRLEIAPCSDEIAPRSELTCPWIVEIWPRSVLASPRTVDAWPRIVLTSPRSVEISPRSVLSCPRIVEISPRKRAHLAAQHGEIPGRVEHGEHAVTPLAGRGVERPFGRPDAPRHALAPARVARHLQALQHAAPPRLEDDARRPAQPLAGPVPGFGLARSVATMHRRKSPKLFWMIRVVSSQRYPRARG